MTIVVTVNTFHLFVKLLSKNISTNTSNNKDW